ncbi:BTAD domain-containing putative transcriptional regulator [Streptomyces sp. NPDC001922]|uniref:AfsR/SARP family transcriptional regulator n=1 Tax=Streptomyces sp. NPDC001922 TaxID=3364624 RepID=UPI00368DD320
MRYAILGTTRAHRDDGSPVALGGVRLRALLTALARHPGRVRPGDALIAEIWDGDPPADATGALQALVGRLRRALGHEAVGSAEGGYRLCAAPDDVDLHRFERLADEGSRALAGGDPARAAALLDDALALWNGPALTDLPGAAAAAARAELRRLDARRARLAADLELGRADRALPELAALCAAHPLNEPLQALRIRALRDTGRRADALAAYEEVRRTIADRLGADPSPGLRSLHAELLSDRLHGDGEVRPPEGEPSDEAPEPSGERRPGPPAGPVRPGNMRARLTSFVGRESDLDILRGDLAAARLVTLLGPGGAGKTRLSQEAAEAVADHWPDGVWFAELAPVEDPQTVPETVLTTLGGRETVLRGSAAELRAATDPSAADPLPRLAEHCARRRMLLVLDNCEHVIGAAAELAEFLLVSCPDVTVLATSREPLGVPGELVRPVEPLPDPVALRLLADRGAAARPGFRTEDDPEACAEICRRLDGLPLAVELAAARLRLLTPRQLADRLDDRFRLLTSGSRTVLPRQQTLRAVVDWSWDLLDDAERAVLRRLSVFAGGCDLPAAEEVCGDGRPGPDHGSSGQGGRAEELSGLPTPVAPAAPSLDARDIAALLGSLVDKSLLVAEPSADGDGMRYRLLETVAEYAAARLDEAAERAVAEHRHLVHFRELARTADPLLRGPDQRRWLERLEQEHDNMRIALRRAIAARDEHEALCLVLSLGWFWQLRDHRTDARFWSAAAGELGPDPFRTPVEPAPDLFDHPIDAPPPMPPHLLQEARRGVRLLTLANMEGNLGDAGSPAMREGLRGMVSAYRAGQPQTCRFPGFMWYYAVVLTGEFEQLRTTVDAAVDGCRAYGYVWELAFVLQFRARLMAEHAGKQRVVRQDADESLEIFVRLGDMWGVAEALSSRGEARERRGEYRAAAEDFREAIRYAQQLGALGQVPLLRTRLGGALIEAGEDETGERMLREALAEGRHSGQDATTFAHLQLAVRLGRTGRTDEARSHLDQLLAEFRHPPPEVFEGVLRSLLGWLDILDGRPEEGLRNIREALVKCQDPLTRIVAPTMPVVQLLNGARGHAALGGRDGAERAARLLGAYDALIPDGHHASALERETRGQAEESARALLTPERYERGHTEGGGLAVEEATALV